MGKGEDSSSHRRFTKGYMPTVHDVFKTVSRISAMHFCSDVAALTWGCRIAVTIGRKASFPALPVR